MNSKLQTGLVTIFLVFLGFLTKPLITIPGGQIFSVPSLLVYILLAWIGLILVMRLIFRIGSDSRSSKKPDNQ